VGDRERQTKAKKRQIKRGRRRVREEKEGIESAKSKNKDSRQQVRVRDITALERKREG
jgi:hypothetical protein